MDKRHWVKVCLLENYTYVKNMKTKNLQEHTSSSYDVYTEHAELVTC